VILEVGPSGSVNNGSQMLRGDRTFNVFLLPSLKLDM
jgi:hypothetical protein